MAFYPKKTEQCWIWKATTTTVGGTVRLIDVEVGDRSSATFKPLFKRVTEKFDPLYNATDDYKVYSKIIPSDQHAVGKDLTYTTEQHNSDTRHWLARFRRKSKVVSKCPEMVRRCLIAVEAVHKGGVLKKLISQVSCIF